MRSRWLGVPRERWGSILARVWLYLAVGIASILFMLPFFWATLSSLKQVSELYTYPPTWFPQTPQWSNYAQIFRDTQMGRWLMNSVYVSGMTIMATVLSSGVTAYGFARFRYPGREMLFLMVLSATMLPEWVTIIPTFIMMSKVHWLDTYKPLLVPSWFGGGAFSIFLLRQVYRTIPMDLDEAARIDGAGPWRILWSILLPLSGPALATVAILRFIGSWNAFMSPLIYLSSEEKFTIAVGIRWFETFRYGGWEQPKEHLLMGASMIMAAPPLVLFFLAQKYFVQGIVMTGIKG